MIVWLIYVLTLNVSVSMIICFWCNIFCLFFISLKYSIQCSQSPVMHIVSRYHENRIANYLKEDVSYCDSQHGDNQPEEIPQSPPILTLKHRVFKKVIHINRNYSDHVILSKHRFDGVFGRRNKLLFYNATCKPLFLELKKWSDCILPIN